MPPADRPPAGPASPPLAAIAIACAALGSFLLVTGLLAPTGAFTLALVAGELMLLIVPLAATLRARRPPAALGLVRPPARLLVAAAAIGASTWYLNLQLVHLLPLPPGRIRSLEAMVEAPPLVVALATLAVVPAVCEELLFRGLLLRALAARLAPAAAIALTAAAFSLYHLSLVQAVPTFTLGLVLGVVAHRGGSIVPAVLGHALNNGVAVLLSRDELPTLARAIGDHPGATTAVCGALCAGGLAIALWPPRAPSSRNP